MNWFGLRPRPVLPVTEEDRAWIDGGFDRLTGLFGAGALREAVVALPTKAFYPPGWDGTEATLPHLLARVCGHMGVDPARVRLRVFAGDNERDQSLRRALPEYQYQQEGAAGYYQEAARPVPPPGTPEAGTRAGYYQARRGGSAPARQATEGEPMPSVIAVAASQLSDPVALAGTLAHELAHVLLLGDRRISPDEPHMEPLTDLCTVFKGMGIFTANTAFRFAQHASGWEVRRQGYLPEEAFGYALARFAHLRGEEEKPPWERHLSANVREYFRRSRAVLRAGR